MTEMMYRGFSASRRGCLWDVAEAVASAMRGPTPAPPQGGGKNFLRAAHLRCWPSDSQGSTSVSGAALTRLRDHEGELRSSETLVTKKFPPW